MFLRIKNKRQINCGYKQGLFVSGDWIQTFFGLKELKIKMSSVMLFVFNAVELCVVTINEKPWTHAREVCKALRYEKKTANIVKNDFSKENCTQKYQMSSAPAAGTLVHWTKDSQRNDYYFSEEGMYELLFSSQQPKAKDFRKHCSNVLFPQVTCDGN